MTISAAVQTKPMPRVTGLARFAIAAGMGMLSGVLLIFAFQPYSLWPLAFFAYVPMQVAAYRVMPRRWAGVPTAIGAFVWLFVCLTSIFGLDAQIWFFPAIALLIAGIAFFADPGWRLFHERTQFRWFVLQGAINTVGVEMLRSFIPPINTHLFMVQTASSQPWLIQPISIFSIYGMSLVIMLVNFALTLFAIAWIDRRWPSLSVPTVAFPRSMRWLVGVGLVLAAWCTIGVISLASAPKNPPTVRVASIQIGFLKPGHQDPTTQEARLQAAAEQTRAAASQGAKLMVWPELGLGFDPQKEHTAELKALAAETKAYLLIGYGIADDPRGWRNEMVMLAPDGAFLPVYAKNHGSSPGEADSVTSRVYPVYDTPYGKLATIICNDVNFTDTTRILAAKGAQLVAVPTWEVSMPGFHYEETIQSVLRAVENRVATVKADTAFASVITDPYGRIIARRDGAPIGEAFALVADVPLGTGNTITMKLGDWVGWLALAGLAAFMIFQNVVNRKSHKSESSTGR